LVVTLSNLPYGGRIEEKKGGVRKKKILSKNDNLGGTRGLITNYVRPGRHTPLRRKKGRFEVLHGNSNRRTLAILWVKWQTEGGGMDATRVRRRRGDRNERSNGSRS